MDRWTTLHSARSLNRIDGLGAIIAVCTFVLPCMAGLEKPQSPSERLQLLLGPLAAKKTTCSAMVVDAVNGTPLFEYESESPLIPASNTKLFVMAAAVDQLGPNFEFQTALRRVGHDLVVTGSGDPAFGDPRLCQARNEEVTAPFQRWSESLRSQGVARISDLVLDESIFDEHYTHPNWEVGDLQKWYGAPVGALNINDNCVDITLRPAEKSGAPVLWDIVPPNPLVTLDNQCKSGGKGEPVIQRTGTEFRYLVTGRCLKPWPFPPLAVPDPGALFGSALHTVLTQNGIAIDGAIRRVTNSATIPYDCAVDIALHVTPLSDVLGRIGKDSQNVFAECLTKRLGYEWERRRSYATPQGSWESGRQAIQDFLSNMATARSPGNNDPWEGLVLDDASGLSRANRTSAAQLTLVLTTMARHPHAALFLDSLSIAGEDGSLAKRGRLKALKGALIGKTGTLRGVRSLSGYLEAESGRRLAFCIILNENGGAGSPLSDITDRFCEIIAAWPGD